MLTPSPQARSIALCLLSGPRMPTTAAAVTAMSWDELQILGATLFADEIASVADGGDTLLRERLASLGPDERRALREALAEPEFV